MSAGDTLGLRIAEGRVPADWIDYNDHMNVAYYVLAFDYAIDALWARIGITEEYIRRTQGSTFAAETHVRYLAELRVDDPYFVTMELIAYDRKRIHQLQRMYHAENGYLAATAEWMSLHVDLRERRVTQWPGFAMDELATIAREQRDLATQATTYDLCGRIRVRTPEFDIYDRTRLSQEET